MNLDATLARLADDPSAPCDVAKVVVGEDEVIFDPFYHGQILTPADCEELVQGVTGRPFRANPEELAITPPGLMLLRLLNNLRGIYLRAGDFPRAATVLGRMRQLAPGDALICRDLGASLVWAGRPGAAIDPLTTFLEMSPGGEDEETARKLLIHARREIARWN